MTENSTFGLLITINIAFICLYITIAFALFFILFERTNDLIISMESDIQDFIESAKSRQYSFFPKIDAPEASLKGAKEDINEEVERILDMCFGSKNFLGLTVSKPTPSEGQILTAMLLARKKIVESLYSVPIIKSDSTSSIEKTRETIIRISNLNRSVDLRHKSINELFNLYVDYINRERERNDFFDFVDLKLEIETEINKFKNLKKLYLDEALSKSKKVSHYHKVIQAISFRKSITFVVLQIIIGLILPLSADRLIPLDKYYFYSYDLSIITGFLLASIAAFIYSYHLTSTYENLTPLLQKVKRHTLDTPKP